MNLWRYVIQHDHGTAPNYTPPYVTLAICKPQIRKSAEPGDLIIAFSGQKLSHRNRMVHDPHNVVWAGIVSEKLSFGEYWSDTRFSDKKAGGSSDWPDNIYEPRGIAYRQIPNNGSHGPDNERRDLSGRYALILSTAWHFFPREHSMPAELGWCWVGPYRRNHRRDLISPRERDSLIEWLSNGPTPEGR